MKIDIYLDNKKDIFHPFSMTTLNFTLANYIYDECIGFKKNTAIELEIKSKEKLTNSDKKLIESLIKNHFIQAIEEERLKDKKSIILYFFLGLIGCIFILASLFVTEGFISEIFNIIGWLSIWELAYDLLFIEGKDNIKIYRYKEIIKANISFK